MADAKDGPRFVWVRNRSACGRGNDPMPQIIHEPVGCAHLDIVADHRPTPAQCQIASGFSSAIDALAVMYPAPPIE